MPHNSSTMSHKNLCLYTLLLSTLLFLIELIYVNSPLSTFYPLQTFTMGALLFVPYSWSCTLPIIFLASANSAIYNINTTGTLILLFTLLFIAPWFRALFLPRLYLFIPVLLAANIAFFAINCNASTKISWFGILTTVLLVALLWNTVRKTIAGGNS